MITFPVPDLNLEARAIAGELRADVATADRLVKAALHAADVKAAFRICYLVSVHRVRSRFDSGQFGDVDDNGY